MRKEKIVKSIILILIVATITNLSLLRTKETRKADSPLSIENNSLIDFPNEKNATVLNSAPNTPRSPPPSDWTIIHYIDGDNNLDPYYEPSASGSDANVDVIALDDGASDGDTRAYHVVFSDSNDEIPLSDIDPSWTDEVNMGDPETLINFSKYCIEKYPSDAYLIIPQNHGGAWKGCCRDQTSLEDSLNISDLKTAFSSIAAYIGHNIDVVLFNDCLMSSIDIAVQLYPYVDYMVGGETVIWVDTWDNCDDIIDVIKATPSITPQELSIEMIDLPSLRDSRYYNSEIISAINCSKILDLQNDINALASELISKFIKYQIKIENARLASEEFIGPIDDVYEMLIDLYDFAENIYNEVPDATIQEYASNIMNDIGPDGGGSGYAVLKERKTTSASFCHGLSLYFPPSEDLYNILYTVGNDFTTNTNWDEFLQKYWEITSNTHPDAPYNPSPSNNSIKIVDNSLTLSVNVSDADGESMDVYFYNASDGCLIGTDIGVSNGAIASAVWSDFSNGKTYGWYAKADDGMINTTSSTWTFTIPNKTIIDETDGIYNFTVAPIPDGFGVNISLSVSSDTEIYFVSVIKNPTNTSLSNALVFIYLTLNESSNLEGMINFTIKYNNSLYENIKLWWFNESANNNRGGWEEILFDDLGNALIRFSVNHASVFSLSEEPVQDPNISETIIGGSSSSNGGGDNGDNDNNFVAIIVITIIMVSGVAGIGIALILFNKKR